MTENLLSSIIGTNLKKDISYLVISDIHFFHDQNESKYIYDSMYEFMEGYSSKSRFAKLDIIFLAGDIFETFKSTKDSDTVIVSNWMKTLMEFCKKNSIKLRVLEGTPGHDWKQSKSFSVLAEAFGSELDYKYQEFLSVEYMEDLGINILYVPDEWAGSAKKCQAQVIDLMKSRGIEKFDIAIMHGMFDFQIPDLGEHPLKHDSAWYLSHVRYFINIGHDHSFKTFDRILVQGSFDRMTHGEEGKKGAIVCYLRLDGQNRFEFIENKLARTFKTIVVKTIDLDKAIAQVKSALEKLPSNSHIRISTSKINPVLTVIDEFKRAYPGMKFKKHEDKAQRQKETNTLQETVSLRSNFVSVSLTPENIVSQILENMENTLDPSDLELLQQELKTLV